MPNLSPKIKKTLFLLIDATLIILAVYLAFLLRFEGQISFWYFQNIFWLTILTLIIYLLFFYSLRLYAFLWEYVSTNELVALAKATTLSLLTLVVLAFVFRDEKAFIGLPRSTLFISYILIFIFCGGVRFAKRFYLQAFKKGAASEKKKTLIVGAGDAGEQFLRSIINLKNSPYLPVGFVDGNSIKRGEAIHGVKVLGEIDDIPAVAEQYEVEEIIIPLSAVSAKETEKAIELGRKAGVKKIQVLPSASEIIGGEFSLANIREIRVEDLLRREPVSLDTSLIKSFISGNSVLITGAAGSIGSEFCRQIAKFNPSLILLLDQDETGIFNISEEIKNKYSKLKIISIISDIQDTEKIKKIFNKFKPNIVFHAAAYKHVPLMEENPDEAVKNNIFGTKVVAEVALKCGTEKFIFISTDKAVNPLSVMGATKRTGEMICQTLNQRKNTKFISVRFGNVLDSRGSVIPIFREQIEKRAPVEVTHPEMERYFMLISEACLLVMQAGAIGEGGEVFVLDMGRPIKILDLAEKMIRVSGLEPNKDIPIVFTGIRPGEKLSEEILATEEGTVATQNQKIFIAKLANINEKKLNQGLEKLKEAANNLDKEKIRTILKEIVHS